MSLFLLSSTHNNNMGFCWHITQNLDTSRLFPFHARRRYFVRMIMCPLLQLWQHPPHSNLLIAFHHLKVKDTIEKFQANLPFQKYERAQTSHSYPQLTSHLSIVLCLTLFSVLLYCSRFFLALWMPLDVFWRRQLLSLLDGGDSFSPVPMAISVEEITLHSSSLKKDLTITGGKLGFSKAPISCLIISMWSAWRNLFLFFLWVNFWKSSLSLSDFLCFHVCAFAIMGLISLLCS